MTASRPRAGRPLIIFLLFAAALFIVGPADASRTTDARSSLVPSSSRELASLELTEPAAISPRFGFAEDLGLLDVEARPSGFELFGGVGTKRCALTYARNNPLKYVDPDGKAPAFAGFVFSAAHGDGYASRAVASLVNTASALGTAAVVWAGGMAAAGQMGGFGLASASWESAYVAATNAATPAAVAQAGGAAGAGGLVINAASRWTDLAPRAAEILNPVQLARVGKVVEISHNWVVRNTLNGIPDAGHLKKIENGLRGLNNARTSLELSLRNPNLSAEARDLMKQALNRATELINRAEALIRQ